MTKRELRIPTDGTTGPSSEWGFISYRGFYVKVAPASMLVDEGRRFTPDETLVAKIDFLPTGNHLKRVLSCIDGMKRFIMKIDNGMPKPEYLFGETNAEVARTATKFGFEATSLPEVEGDIEYRVIGKTKEVREIFEKLLQRTDRKGRNIVDLLNRRLELSQASSPSVR